VPELGGSGVTAAVLGAYIVLCPASRVLTWIFPATKMRIGLVSGTVSTDMNNQY